MQSGGLECLLTSMQRQEGIPEGEEARLIYMLHPANRTLTEGHDIYVLVLQQRYDNRLIRGMSTGMDTGICYRYAVWVSLLRDCAMSISSGRNIQANETMGLDNIRLSHCSDQRAPGSVTHIDLSSCPSSSTSGPCPSLT